AHVARRFCTSILRGCGNLALPLCYPDPNGEFFGYDRVCIPAWYPVGTTHGFKELIAAVTRISTCLIAARTGHVVVGKAASVANYRELIGDEWSAFLGHLLEEVRHSNYCVPDSHEHRATLRELCRLTLGWENAFLTAVGSTVTSSSRN